MFKKNRISASIAMENILDSKCANDPPVDEDQELINQLMQVVLSPEASEEDKKEAKLHIEQLGGEA